MVSDVEEKETSDAATNVSNIDLNSLLEAASNMNFQQDDGYTESKGKFEKASSLFDIVKSVNADRTNASSQEDVDFKMHDSQDENSDSDDTFNIDPEEVDEQEQTELYEQTHNNLDDGDEAGTLLSKSDLFEERDSFKETPVNQDSEQKKDDGTKPENNILDDTPEKTTEGDVADESSFDQSSYDKGYQAALNEFEKTIEREKSDLIEVTNLLIQVGDDYKEQIEDILREKTFKLVNEFIGREIDTSAEDFAVHIKNCAKAVITTSNSFLLELGHSDLVILQKHFENDKSNFELVENPRLNRGEFKIISGPSGYEQILDDT